MYLALKKGDPTQISNYGPITILSIFSKVFESIAYKYIYYNISSFISKSQLNGKGFGGFFHSMYVKV